MKIENVTRISFAAWWATQKQRHLAVRNSLLGQIIINDQRVHAIVAEILTNRTTGKRCEILKRGWFRRCRRNDDSVIQSAALFEGFNNLSNGRTLLTNRNVDTEKLFAIVFRRSVGFFLVQDGVDTDSGFTGLTVTNDQLALTTTNWDHPVNRLNPGHHRLVHGFTWDNAWGFNVHTVPRGNVCDRAFAVDWVAEWINHTTQQAFTNRCSHNLIEALNSVAFFNATVITEDNDTNIVAFQVQRHTFDAAVKFDHLTGLDIVEAVDAGNTVANGEDLTDVRDFSLDAKILDLRLKNAGDFCCANRHVRLTLPSWRCSYDPIWQPHWHRSELIQCAAECRR